MVDANATPDSMDIKTYFYEMIQKQSLKEPSPPAEKAKQLGRTQSSNSVDRQDFALQKTDVLRYSQCCISVLLCMKLNLKFCAYLIKKNTAFLAKTVQV